jgi:hypothetical protein
MPQAEDLGPTCSRGGDCLFSLISLSLYQTCPFASAANVYGTKGVNTVCWYFVMRYRKVIWRENVCKMSGYTGRDLSQSSEPPVRGVELMNVFSIQSELEREG